MDSSPKGRRIRPVTGDASAIISRGTTITDLGEKMITSAAVLKSVAEGAEGQRGLAVDKLKEVIGDSHAELKLAGERYKPTGPVLVGYGNVLAEVQPLISTAVTDCENEWARYLSKHGAAADMQFSPQRFLPADDPQSAVYAQELQSARGDADAARKAWVAEAQRFDSHVDTWETAFNSAADQIGTANEGSIKDGFWDDVDGYVSGALTVLKWVGLALTVAAIIIGGPIIAALSAIVAVSVLILTIYQRTRGDASWRDVGFASIGVIPFGSLGKLGSIGKAGPGRFADNLLGGLVTRAGRAGIRTELSVVSGSAQSAFRFSGSGIEGARNGFSHFARNHGTDGRLVDTITRFFSGKNASALTSAKPADIIVSTWWSMAGRLNTGLSWGTGEGLWSRLVPGGSK